MTQALFQIEDRIMRDWCDALKGRPREDIIEYFGDAPMLSASEKVLSALVVSKDAGCMVHQVIDVYDCIREALKNMRLFGELLPTFAPHDQKIATALAELHLRKIGIYQEQKFRAGLLKELAAPLAVDLEHVVQVAVSFQNTLQDMNALTGLVSAYAQRASENDGNSKHRLASLIYEKQFVENILSGTARV